MSSFCCHGNGEPYYEYMCSPSLVVKGVAVHRRYECMCPPLLVVKGVAVHRRYECMCPPLLVVKRVAVHRRYGVFIGFFNFISGETMV